MRYNGFLDLLRFMRSSLETIHPVRVRRTKMPQGRDGDCQLKNNVFLIRIEKTLPESHAMDVLLHELGHCLAWNEKPETMAEMHGPSWGDSYSFVYRKFLEWEWKG